MKHALLGATLLAAFTATAQLPAAEHTNHSKFRQLQTLLRTPNTYRTASGAPGPDYWQQRADYVMQIHLDDANQRISGRETITYHNSSPDVLHYLWLQLDQNIRQQDSDANVTRTDSIGKNMTFTKLRTLHDDFDGGFKIEYVRASDDHDLPYTINKTMMRVDLPHALKPGTAFSFKVKWWYNINDRLKDGGRSGYEFFKNDGNYIYAIAQFFPRMAVYNEVEGWQHKQFLGDGEFALPFGNYEVSLTVPADHVVGATGVLQNPEKVLTRGQRRALQKARNATSPVVIIGEEEARQNETSHSSATKTWVFKAQNVRDFAFASSRKFIWDAMGVRFGRRIVMAMSLYPKEGNPLWERYATKVVAHALRSYSAHTFEYPYQVAWAIHTARIGMEYPMICFNRGRPEADGTYSARTKYRMISTITHEVGHNFFPMIVNSDERQWTWLDEGLNAFLQYLTEQAWERDYPSRRGAPAQIVKYMKSDFAKQTPIMTNSESLLQFGNNAYTKTATALNILRETILGRDLFDFAFQEYARRWMFKHPTPDDFFRTMEDASGTDLDWFWRGWFFTTEHVDLAIDAVEWYRPGAGEATADQELARAPENISTIRNRESIARTAVEADESLADFYTKHRSANGAAMAGNAHAGDLKSLTEDELKLIRPDENYYVVHFSNRGGLVMPLIIEFLYADGSSEVKRIPAEIWRHNEKNVSRIFVSDKVLSRVVLDPFLETADVYRANNEQAAPAVVRTFMVRRRKVHKPKNLMQLRKPVETEQHG